jgi:hypothetical protein
MDDDKNKKSPQRSGNPQDGQQIGNQSLRDTAGLVKVLLRLHPDGFAEVYADDRITLHVQKVLTAPGARGEQLAIELADLTLPSSHRGLDDCRKLVSTFDCKPVTVEQFVTRQATMSALKIFDAYSERASQ